MIQEYTCIELFLQRNAKYLKNGGLQTEDQLKPFVIDYLHAWMKERGSGHYKFINEIMYMLYSHTLTSVLDKNKPELIEMYIKKLSKETYIIESGNWKTIKI